ncbi:CLUMA_CG005293, isoform A [Clunio marinus]|uniref:CLUMA_CG005293, isoform A n=1 Tax=Clunio marinus TaxID=568069 RepID=A0A1J1HVR4_9DIPT|nr:CLUMA_CG005293, isoform A [Clunio marinus]
MKKTIFHQNDLRSASPTLQTYKLKSSEPDRTNSSLSPANVQLFIVHEL